MLLPQIETERLLLRMYRAEDLELVYLLLKDKNVTRFSSERFTVDRVNVLSSLPRRLERWRKQRFGQLGVFEKASEKLIGYCGLQYLDDTEEVEIYYGLHKDFWYKGLATETARAILRFGFETVKLSKIVAITHLENTNSQKVLTKIGLIRGANAQFYSREATYFALAQIDYRSDVAIFYQLTFQEYNFPAE